MKISVITTAYNSAATLRDTFESMLRQTFKDVEYLVIDGASSDGTVDIIRTYEPRFNGRMRWISEPDNGLYDAMNKGIAMATGEVVGFLNSDDFYTSDDVLATVAETLGRTGADAVYGDVHYVKPDDLDRTVRYYSSQRFSRGWMILGFMPAHPSFYCRRQIYRDYGTFDTRYKVAADFECLLRFIYIHGITTVCLPKDFVTMRTGGTSTSGLRSHRQIMKDHRRALRSNGVCSCTLLLSLRYVYKVWELLFGKRPNRLSHSNRQMA